MTHFTLEQSLGLLSSAAVAWLMVRAGGREDHPSLPISTRNAERRARKRPSRSVSRSLVESGPRNVMGTCRMGADPRTSVVDADLRVHGRRNCFVISTAVFPTVGTANPTLTLAALSLRGAEAVRRSLAEGEVSR